MAIQLQPNTLPRKGVAIPKYDLRSIWTAVGFQPHAGQLEVFDGWTLHNTTTAVMGTRWGKSELAGHLPLAHIAPCWREVTVDGKRIRVDHQTTGAVIAPTYRLTGIIMGKLYQNILKLCRILGYSTKGARSRTVVEPMPEDGAAGLSKLDAEPGFLTVRKVNGQIHNIITPWGSRVDAFTMAEPQGLLGLSFDWLMTDESGQFIEKDWNNYYEYADRALIDREGWVYHGTTPKGFNDLYTKFFMPGQPGPERNLDFISFQQPTHRNTHLNLDWLEKKRKTTPARLWAMNYLAQFTILDGQVYEEFSRDLHVRLFDARPEWLYFLCMDFGFTDPFVCHLMAWTGLEFVVVAEVYEAGLTTLPQKRLITDMVAKFMPRGADWLDARDGKWTAWGDPRGAVYRAEFAAVGLPIRKPKVRTVGQRGEIEATSQIVAEFLHPTEEHRYAPWAARVGDNRADEQGVIRSPRLIVHERCTHTIHSFQTWVRDGNGYDGDDHPVDSLRYGITGARHHALPLSELIRRRRHTQPEAGQNRTANRIRSRVMRGRNGQGISLGRR